MPGPISANTADGSEREIEVTSVAQLGRRFFYEIPGSSYICNSGIAWTAPRAQLVHRI